jgi:hypothetical protein
MRHTFSSLLMLGLLSLSFASHASERSPADGVSSWDFDVYLDEKKVGKHLFTVSEADGVKRVQSDASFKVRILFILAYRYEHRAAESWADNCLVGIDASTNANGERTDVSGQKAGAGFLIENGAGPTELPQCVMTFAYWNHEFLDQSRLLNPQTGEYVDVQVEKVGDEILAVRGHPVAATRFKLTSNEVDVTLWYSSNNEWLALESVAKGGHIIRYELS